MKFSPLIENLINSLCSLPGIGPKSAQRMAFNLLEKNKQAGLNLAESLKESITNVRNCNRCRILCETDICSICNSSSRDTSLLCVVESPADVLAIEKTNIFSGLYFVLLGKLSPIDGIGPEEIGVDLYKERLKSGDIKEIIIATNPTVEGEATAYYLGDLAKSENIKITRIAHGVPMGGELEYIDNNTISKALASRSELF